MENTGPSQTPASVEHVRLPFRELLANRPPCTTAICDDAVISRDRLSGIWLARPEVQLWCDSETCQNLMFFESTKDDDVSLSQGKLNLEYQTYRCKHCEGSQKIFSLLVCLNKNQEWFVTKVGEWPPYGPRLPNRVLKLVQADVECMRLGRRAEAMSFGIGAFAYYRRVVERQKDALFDKVIAVSKKIGAKAELLEALESAKRDFQFSKSLEGFKVAIPDSLLINGENPLTLLHKALSAGIHNDSDQECLSLAHDIRVVLTELAGRSAAILREQSELNEAVKRLVQRK